MNLVEEFCEEAGLRVPLDTEDIYFKADNSKFNVIDGEEGDYGVIEYYSLDERLIAIKTVNGGDDSEIDFTKFGKDLLTGKAVEILIKNIKCI